MFRKVKPEKIAGIVALSYLVLIPAGAALVWRKIQLIELDVAELWTNAGMPDEPRPSLIDLPVLKRFAGRR
jgi:hypothetical protein